jgi:predicted N-acetyltransferase YhbS
MNFEGQAVGRVRHGRGNLSCGGERHIDICRVAPVKAAPLPKDAALVEIKPLLMAEPIAVEALLDAAFGPDRHGRTAYRLRAGCAAIAALSFSAWADGALIGTLQSWPVAHVAGTLRTPLVMVGPVAVLPALQQGGIGRLLMAALIDVAESHADGALMMIGDPDYYGRFFGFSADATSKWDVPGPVERHRLLARALPGRAVPDHAGGLIPDPNR